MNSIRYPFTTKWVQSTKGGRVAYIDEGAGPKTLVFIHGVATYAMSWGRNIGALRQHYRCIALDLPGNGLSQTGHAVYSMQFFAAVVYEVIQLLKLESVCLVGHSMGAQVALTLALNQPHFKTELILCAPAGFEVFTPLEVGMYTAALRAADFFSSPEQSLRQSIRSSFHNQQPDAEQMIRDLIDLMHQQSIRQYKKTTEACIVAMLQEPVFRRLPAVRNKTLVLFGEQDALIPNRLIHPTTTRQIATAATRQLPNARLQMIQQCGHFLQWEKASVVNDLILQFLNGPK